MNDFNQKVSDQELAVLIQDHARRFCPEAVCEIRDYGKRVGLGTLDANGEIQEQVFLKKEVTPEYVEIYARLLQKKLDKAAGSEAQ